MKIIKIQRINEFHPGAKSIRETIEYFIQIGEEKGISREAHLIAIQMFLEYFSGNPPEKVERGSEVAMAIEIIERAIRASEDDGYPLSWIQEELEKFIDTF